MIDNVRIPHSLEAVIQAVEALAAGEPLPADWGRSEAPQSRGDVVGIAATLLAEIIKTAGDGSMNIADFESLDEAARVEALAKGLAALKTKIPDGPNLSPIEQQIAVLQASIDTITTELVKVSSRVGAIEAAILKQEVA